MLDNKGFHYITVITKPQTEGDEETLKGESCLDGYYVIKTDLKKGEADTDLVHDWYKDLSEVEKVFRGCKAVNLEVRPVCVRKEESTRGHVFVVMLAYLIIRRLRDAWTNFDLTVEGVSNNWRPFVQWK